MPALISITGKECPTKVSTRVYPLPQALSFTSAALLHLQVFCNTFLSQSMVEGCIGGL